VGGGQRLLTISFFGSGFCRSLSSCIVAALHAVTLPLFDLVNLEPGLFEVEL
jgi:hypothetical protein